MVAVQEVISSLEKYPITKEALEVSISGLNTREGSEGRAWAAPTQVFPGFLEPQRLCSLAQWVLKRSEGGVPSWPALCQPTAHAPRVPSSHRHCRKWVALVWGPFLCRRPCTLWGACPAEVPVSDAGSGPSVCCCLCHNVLPQDALQ